MNEALDKEWIKTVLEECEGRGLATVWSYSEFENQTFGEHCEAFFWILEKVLESGQVRLMSKGEYLTGTPRELVQLFKDAFPKADVRETVDDMRFWFYGDPPDPCPAIAVWRYEHTDGRVQWMPCP